MLICKTMQLAVGREASGKESELFVEVVDNDDGQVDAGADNIASQCRNLIFKFRGDVDKQTFNVSAHEHYESVALGLDR